MTTSRRYHVLSGNKSSRDSMSTHSECWKQSDPEKCRPECRYRGEKRCGQQSPVHVGNTWEDNEDSSYHTRRISLDQEGLQAMRSDVQRVSTECDCEHQFRNPLGSERHCSRHPEENDTDERHRRGELSRCVWRRRKRLFGDTRATGQALEFRFMGCSPTGQRRHFFEVVDDPRNRDEPEDCQ